MPNSREIKRRMTSISNTRQITSAMKMVSASKLRKAQLESGTAAPYRDKLREVLGHITSGLKGKVQDPLLELRPIERMGFVVMASNKGLAGGYNSNLLNYALKRVKEAEAKGYEIGIIAVGRTVNDYFLKRGYTVDHALLDTQDLPDIYDAERIVKIVRTDYEQGRYDQISVVYQSFISAMSQVPVESTLLPISLDHLREEGEGEGGDVDYAQEFIYEPSADALLAALLPMYLLNHILAALAEAKTGEHGARMTAMTAATDNAGELLEKLEVSYNRARQSAITNEISEIVAGADALS